MSNFSMKKSFTNGNRIVGGSGIMYEKKPWLKFYGDVPVSIDYPRISMHQALMRSVEKNPDSIAYDFMGSRSSYRKFAADIEILANALSCLGLAKGDCITISMPTTPQGILCFYAANRLGAVASMIPPESTAEEIRFYLNISKSKFVLTLDVAYPYFKEILNDTDLKVIIVTNIGDCLPGAKRIGYYMKKGRKFIPSPKGSHVRWWKDLMKKRYPPAPKEDGNADDLAVILFSGGTTGTPKGVMLSNLNFISEGMQAAAWGNFSSEDSILTSLPLFHGFGLGVCVNAIFMGGGTCIMTPTSKPESIAKLIKEKKPTFIVGVPTLYESLSRSKNFQGADLRHLKAAFSGADTLPRKTKEAFEETVRRGGGAITLLEGYGLTEAVTAIMATPLTEYRAGSIGIPYPDILAKIVREGTEKEAPIGEDGELCIYGPPVMLGYLGEPEETAKTLRKHADGHVWLHTGDIVSMDEDGFFYYKLRLKRMIKSAGMIVYPGQVEAVLLNHPDVKAACVTGTPDRYRGERVKGFVILEEPDRAGKEMEEILINHCRKSLISWSCPHEVEFRKDLPLTAAGKIAFKELEKEEVEKQRFEEKSGAS
jgi:long-chain acyl-CoA synthetase